MGDEGKIEESGMAPIFLALETGYMVIPSAAKHRKYKKNSSVD